MKTKAIKWSLAILGIILICVAEYFIVKGSNKASKMEQKSVEVIENENQQENEPDKANNINLMFAPENASLNAMSEEFQGKVFVDMTLTNDEAFINSGNENDRFAIELSFDKMAEYRDGAGDYSSYKNLNELRNSDIIIRAENDYNNWYSGQYMNMDENMKKLVENYSPKNEFAEFNGDIKSFYAENIGGFYFIEKWLDENSDLKDEFLSVATEYSNTYNEYIEDRNAKFKSLCMEQVERLRKMGYDVHMYGKSCSIEGMFTKQQIVEFAKDDTSTYELRWLNKSQWADLSYIK